MEPLPPLHETTLEMTNEGMLLDMANQMKEKYEENENKIKKYKDRYDNLLKEVITFYGLIRVLDNLINEAFDMDSEILVLSEILRGHSSEVYNNFL